jgi:hypothetical protein
MQQNKIPYILIFSTLLFSACIDRYYPETVEDFEPKIVVEAFLNDNEILQKIAISKTTAPDSLFRNPLSGCFVEVLDDKGNAFQFSESRSEPGYYYCSIDKSYFTTGTKFQLHFNTPEGNEYLSETDQLSDCPEVNELDYELQFKPTSDPNLTEDGLQFFVDLKADENFSRFYRWTIDETWEYHSQWPIIRYIDMDGVYHRGPIDSSKFTCYSTEQVKSVFILSTNDLISNNYSNFELHFVNDHTQKLLYRYSILVKQHSISEKAFRFWEAVAKNNLESGGFFETQPIQAIGNVHNIADTTERVIGLFSVSKVTSKRISIFDVPELSFAQVPYCTGRKIEGPLAPDEPKPIYFVYITDADGVQANAIANQECLDCTMRGGTTTLPSFWSQP